MFLSVVRKTSKAASSAALGSSPLLSVSQPRSFVFLTMWSLVGAEGGNGAVAEDEVGHSREVFGHSSKLDHSKLVPRNALVFTGWPPGPACRLSGLTHVKLAGATGLEPATSCVTGRRSNQLNYAPANSLKMTSLSLHNLAVSCAAFHVLRRNRASFST